VRGGLAAALLCIAGLALPFVVGDRAASAEGRLAALRSVFDLGGRGRFGDVNPSLRAARRLARDPRAPLYDRVESEGSSFIYPPLALALYRPFADRDVEDARRAIVAANHVLFFLVCLLLGVYVARQPAARPWEAALVIPAALVFHPLTRALEINQATLVVTFLVALAFVALAEGWPAAAGCALAAAAVIKPHLVLLLPFLFAIPRVGIAAVAAAATAGGMLLATSVAYAGWANHVDYVTRVIPMLSAGYAFYPNQSWNGLFNRLYDQPPPTEFVLAPPRAAVRVASYVFGLATYVVALAAARRSQGTPPSPTVLLSLAWIATTVVSPIAWDHHYAPALFAFATLYAVCRSGARRPAWLPAATAVAFALMAGYFDVRALQGAGPRLLASTVFAGGLLLMAACIAALRVGAAEGTSGDRQEARGA
jgi:hypothetical protein